jgi:hypothetical protein
MEAHPGAMEAHPGPVEVYFGAVEPHLEPWNLTWSLGGSPWGFGG